MASNPTSLWEILVPTVSNAGKPFRLRFHRVWDQKVREIAGGLTIMQPVKGQWVLSDTLFQERMIPVRIACDDAQIAAISDFTAKYYGQHAIMYYRISDQVCIRSYHGGDRRPSNQ